MRNFKVFLILLLCLVMCLGAVACQSPNNGEAESTEEAPAPSLPSITLLDGGESKYEIIYPLEAGNADERASAELQAAFLDATGVKLERRLDIPEDGEDRSADTCKILVGKTEYSASERAFEDLLYQDYHIEIADTHLVVAAYTDDGYTAAIEWLKENVFSKAENGKLIMESDAKRDSTVSGYPSSITVLGNPLHMYTIVYANIGDLEAVRVFRDKVAERTGSFMDIVLDIDAEPSDHEILYGDTNRGESSMVDTPDALNYVVRVINQKIVIKAGGAHSSAKLVEQLYDVLTDGMDDVKIRSTYAIDGDYYDDPYNTTLHQDADIRVMSANVMAHLKGYEGDADGFDFNRRAEIFMAALDFYQPTVVGLQEFCADWYSVIKNYNDIDKWDILKFSNPKLSGTDVTTTIMYRKDKLTLIDSGMKWFEQYNNNRICCYTWAVLEVKETGERFCFISNHWTQAKPGDEYTTNMALSQVAEVVEFINEMKKTYPVYTTGDFNNNEFTTVFKTYLKDADIVDAFYEAETKYNAVGSWHDWGKDKPSSGSCDHITSTKDSTILKFETIMSNEQIYASDHAWLIADIKI